MQTAQFRYRCRLCGKKYTYCESSAKLGEYLMPFIAYGYKVPSDLIIAPPKLIEPHVSCKKGYGIGDFIGIVFVEE